MRRTFSDPYSLTLITDAHQSSPELEDFGVTPGNEHRKDKSFVATEPDIMSIMRWYKRSIEPEEADADHPLGKWAELVRNRRKIFKTLSKRSKQTPECLAENIGKRYEQILDKTLLEEAQKYKVSDKYRGHPKWYTTVKPKKECEKESIVHVMFPGNTKFQDDPDVMRNKCYFGVPKAILKEQNIGKDCPAKEKPEKWNNDPYLAKRKKELHENISILEDFRPDIDQLYVKGKGLGPTRSKTPTTEFDIPVIIITPPEEDEESLLKQSENRKLTKSLAIEKPILFIDNVPVGNGFPESDNHQWLIGFPMADLNEPKTITVNFRNIGPCAVRYEWRMERDYDNLDFPLRDYKRRAARFYFVQKRGILLPGQQMDVDFTFKSPSNGVFREFWRFNTTPKVRHLLIHFILEGIASEKEVKSDVPWSDIESYIQQLIMDSSVQNILDEIERGIVVPKLHAPYCDMFGDNELFEFNNPKLHYRTREVAEMKEIYGNVSDKRWNFSALKLRNTIIEAGLSCEDTIKYMNQLNHLVGELLHPPKEEKMERMKFNMVYTMLCAFFNQMGTVGDRLLKKMSCQRLPNVDTKYPPMEFDDPFERWMIEHVRTEPSGTMSEKAYKKQQARQSSAGGRKSKAGGSRQSSAGRKSAAGKRQSAAGKRQSAAGKRQSAAGKRQSAAGGGKKRQSAAGGKRQSAASGGKKRQSAASGGSRKSMKPGGAKKKSPSLKSVKGQSPGNNYIWLTDPPQEQAQKLEFLKEHDRDVFRGLLEAYTRDLLGMTVDKICSAIDTINTVEAGKDFDKEVDPVAYKEHYKKPKNIPQLPSLF